ncbi:MAG: hypothetical protein IJU91_04120 [Selenomonadaceae bacterium]|nr:hypothetical protein [Selenomonadaceae bacterium]
MRDYFDDFEFNIDIEYEEEDYDWDYDYYYDDWDDDYYYYDYSPRYNYRDYDYYDYSPSYNYNQRNDYTQNNSYTENNYTQNNYTQNNNYNQTNNYTQNNSYTENNYTQNNNYVTNNYYNTDNSGSSNTSTQSNSIIGYVRNYFTESFSQFSFSNVFSTLTSRRGFGQSLFGSTSLFNFGMQAVGAIGGNLLNNWLGGGQQSYSGYSYAAQSIKAMTVEGGDNKEVWLANESEEVMINAVNTYGSNVLAGNNKNNQIFGGNGNNQMWGGSYQTNDYLFGGEGQNTFWYGKGEGIDLVENTKTGDTINLYNINLDDISNLEITDSAITLVVGEDQGIGVTNSDEVSPNFKLANGETYNYNRTVGQWQQA